VDTGPVAILCLFLKTLFFFVAAAWGLLWLLRKKYGGVGGGDVVVLIAAGFAALAALLTSDHLLARYIEQVGKPSQGVLISKTYRDGENSTTFYANVQFGYYEGEFEVSEGYYDFLQPRAAVPVLYDPDYRADFVPKVVIQESPQAWAVLGIELSVALIMLGTLCWIMLRAKQRIFPSKK
jgi:hypothetical protein